jgi:acid phosphatase class B
VVTQKRKENSKGRDLTARRLLRRRRAEKIYSVTGRTETSFRCLSLALNATTPSIFANRV